MLAVCQGGIAVRCSDIAGRCHPKCHCNVTAWRLVSPCQRPAPSRHGAMPGTPQENGRTRGPCPVHENQDVTRLLLPPAADQRQPANGQQGQRGGLGDLVEANLGKARVGVVTPV